ncbi:MBL fold metallo-hydrolase [Nakamurella lactea]|uniref:MBL fold metallo-hydrolase n=1 Tax=Nakamurella lactea TaxID=459515 RepID=UPI000408B7E8|nr:MBL fold metallo-hydrolase [Nakamurella lactea]
MLIAGFPAGSFQANCYVIAAEPGGECAVIDPGENSAEPLAEVLRQHRLTPAAVLLTHGHLDHVAGANELCRSAGVPAYLHAADQHLLDDPLAGLSEPLRRQLAGMDLTGLRPPEVRSFDDSATLELAGLRVAVDPVPGHTPGSVVFRLAAAVDPNGGRPELLFTGDTLFAGSVGRTDLPGGSWDELRHSLRSVLLTRADDAVVLPGHGPSSTIGTERGGNPFLIG